jgi:hypothetical protein
VIYAGLSAVIGAFAHERTVPRLTQRNGSKPTAGDCRDRPLELLG